MPHIIPISLAILHLTAVFRNGGTGQHGLRHRPAEPHRPLRL